MRRRTITDVPVDLRIYDRAQYRAEAPPDEDPSEAYHRALLDAGVDNDLAGRLRAFALLCDVRAEHEPDNPEWHRPRELFPFDGSMFGRPVKEATQ